MTIAIFLLFLILFCGRLYYVMKPYRIFDDYNLKIHRCAEFYPYTSIFNKDSEPYERTLLHNYWGDR